MLEIPANIEFGHVQLNQTYQRNLEIRNPLGCPVEFEIRPGSDRFTVSPCGTLHVDGNGTIRVILRLRITKWASRRGSQDQVMLL